MAHKLRFFRFTNRTHIPTTGTEFSMDEFFSEVKEQAPEDAPLLTDEQSKSKPQKHREESV
jgi:hypothetical protein